MIHARTIDNAGNTSNDKTADAWKDSTPPPEAILSYSSKTNKIVVFNISMSGTDISGVAKYIFEYKKSSETNWTTAIEQTSLPSSYEYTGLTAETAYNFRVRTIDNAGNESTGTSISQTTNAWTFNEDEDVGKIVNYTPKSGQSYTVSQTYSGYTSDQNWSTSNYSGTWSIWGQDTSYIYIISTQSTTGVLYLKGALGYNNAVELLDRICDTCFTDKTQYPSSVGKNLKVEQVLGVTKTGIPSTDQLYGTNPYTYNISYPYVWNTYESTWSGARDNRSTAFGLTTNTTTTKKSATPYANHFMGGTSRWGASNWKTEKYWNLVVTGRGRDYFLSSRAVYPRDATQIDFSILKIYSEVFGTERPYYKASSGTLNGTVSKSLRPILSFPTSLYKLQEKADGTFDIVRK